MSAQRDSVLVSTPVIRVSALVLRDAAGRVLNVRKQGTHMLMLPGGKPLPGETAAETAVREAHEELGISLSVRDLTSLGVFRAAAANESDHDVEAAVFLAPQAIAHTQVRALAEIVELAWLRVDDARRDQAPLNIEHVFPLLRARPPQ